MPAETSVNAGGTWYKIPTNGLYVNGGGIWQQVNYGYVQVGGTWQNIYVRDATGPSAPTNGSASWTTTNGTPTGTPALSIQWTNPTDADYAYMSVMCVPWGQPPLSPFTASNPTNFVFYTAYIPNNVPFDVYLTPYDVNGNPGTTLIVQSMAWCGKIRGRSPTPTVEIYPEDTGSWRLNTGAYNTGLATYRVVQAAAYGGGDHIGMYFYGDQVYNKLAGAQLQSGTMEYFRVNSMGAAGQVAPQAWFSPHRGSKAAGSPVGQLFEPVLMQGVSRDGSFPGPYFQQLIHGNWYDNVTTGNSAGTIRSIAFYRPGYVAEFYGNNDNPGWVVPGRLIFTHNG